MSAVYMVTLWVSQEQECAIMQLFSKRKWLYKKSDPASSSLFSHVTEASRPISHLYQPSRNKDGDSSLQDGLQTWQFGRHCNNIPKTFTHGDKNKDEVVYKSCKVTSHQYRHCDKLENKAIFGFYNENLPIPDVDSDQHKLLNETDYNPSVQVSVAAIIGDGNQPGQFTTSLRVNESNRTNLLSTASRAYNGIQSGHLSTAALADESIQSEQYSNAVKSDDSNWTDLPLINAKNGDSNKSSPQVSNRKSYYQMSVELSSLGNLDESENTENTKNLTIAFNKESPIIQDKHQSLIDNHFEDLKGVACNLPTYNDQLKMGNSTVVLNDLSAQRSNHKPFVSTLENKTIKQASEHLDMISPSTVFNSDANGNKNGVDIKHYISPKIIPPSSLVEEIGRTVQYKKHKLQQTVLNKDQSNDAIGNSNSTNDINVDMCENTDTTSYRINDNMKIHASVVCEEVHYKEDSQLTETSENEDTILDTESVIYDELECLEENNIKMKSNCLDMTNNFMTGYGSESDTEIVDKETAIKSNVSDTCVFKTEQTVFNKKNKQNKMDKVKRQIIQLKATKHCVNKNKKINKTKCAKKNLEGGIHALKNSKDVSNEEMEGIYCNKCKHMFKYKKRYLNHLAKNRCRHECDFCGKVFLYGYTSHYKMHMKYHFNLRNYVCNVCGVSYIEKRKLDEHMNKHTGEKAFMCDTCGMTFTGYSTFHAHRIRRHSNNLEKFQCDKCPKAFKYYNGLLYHLKHYHKANNWESDRPYNCNFCGKSFQTPGILKRHETMHRLSKDFVCDICGAAFIRIQGLTDHKKRHSKQFTKFCKQCNKGFYNSASLVSHMRSHTGEKPFHCSHCEYKCALKGNLTKHMKKHCLK